MEIRTIDQEGIDFIIKEEGIVLHPYLDKVRVPTIGIGMTYYPTTGKKVTMKDNSITRNEAIAMYLSMVKNYNMAVYSTTRDDINQHQFNALVSICYNIGTNGFKNSTLLKRVNENSSETLIRAAFDMWNKAGGKVNSVLKARRKREADLYFKK